MNGERVPILRADELIRAIERIGFRLLRKSASGHRRYGHPDGRKATVPMHKGTTIGKGLLRKILRDVGLTVEELKDLL